MTGAEFWADFTEQRVSSAGVACDGVPVSAEALLIDARTFADWSGLSNLRRLRRLSVAGATAAHLKHLASVRALEGLWLSDVRAESIAAFAALSSLRWLAIACAPKLRTLDGLEPLTTLQGLWLRDLHRLESLEALAALTSLRELSLESAPGRDARGPQRVASLFPLEHLVNLERFDSKGIVPADGSLRPLHKLKRLRWVHLPNAVALAECAALAAALPQAQGNFRSPLWPTPEVACRKCGGETVMLLAQGRRARCIRCDAETIASHVAAFEREVAQAAEHQRSAGR